MPKPVVTIDDITAVIQAMQGALKSCSDCKAIPADAFRGLDNQARRVLTAISDGLFQTDILITVSGGVCQSIHARQPELIGKAVLRDFDVEGSELEEAEAGDLHDIDGSFAREVHLPVDRFEDLDILPFTKRVTTVQIRVRFQAP